MNISDVDKLFFISSYAKYKGELFTASEEGGTGKVLLDTTDTELAKKWILNGRINLCTPKWLSGKKWKSLSRKKCFHCKVIVFKL